ncbi:hypothetical protein FB451DRAFT_1277613 [Mycena latifolia]|nr:hypothetical protein FB451DRAFT_1277613 [Mycena latifolia]
MLRHLGWHHCFLARIYSPFSRLRPPSLPSFLPSPSSVLCRCLCAAFPCSAGRVILGGRASVAFLCAYIHRLDAYIHLFPSYPPSPFLPLASFVAHISYYSLHARIDRDVARGCRVKASLCFSRAYIHSSRVHPSFRAYIHLFFANASTLHPSSRASLLSLVWRSHFLVLRRIASSHCLFCAFSRLHSPLPFFFPASLSTGCHLAGHL